MYKRTKTLRNQNKLTSESAKSLSFVRDTIMRVVVQKVGHHDRRSGDVVAHVMMRR